MNVHINTKTLEATMEEIRNGEVSLYGDFVQRNHTVRIIREAAQSVITMTPQEFKIELAAILVQSV